MRQTIWQTKDGLGRERQCSMKAEKSIQGRPAGPLGCVKGFYLYPKNKRNLPVRFLLGE